MSAPLPEPTVRWVFTSWRGRLSRKSYFLGAMLMLVAQIYIIIQVGNADQENDNIMTIWGLVLIVSWAVSLYFLAAMTVKRLHDMDRPAWFAMFLPIPWLGMLLVLACMILAGSQKTNAHGPPPFPEA